MPVAECGMGYYISQATMVLSLCEVSPSNTHTHARTHTPSPQINFLLGADGEPWVWVMGEHLNDLSYEELVKRREREKMAELQDRKEAEELAKQDTRDILSLASESLVI